jgi:hypothetical protein
MNNEVELIWKEMIMALCDVLTRNLRGGNEDGYEKLQ